MLSVGQELASNISVKCRCQLASETLENYLENVLPEIIHFNENTLVGSQSHFLPYGH